MTTNILQSTQDIESLYNRLIDLSMQYQALDGIATDVNKPSLAREINTAYMTLAILAVQHGQADVFSIPDDIADLVRGEILTIEAVPLMVQSFSEPVIDMCIDVDVVEDALKQMRLETN